jgi:hypothetical protein
MPHPIPGAPAEIAAEIDRLTNALTQAAGPNLAGLILYGGLARGRFRPGNSDVNVVVLLHDASFSALIEIAPALQTARRSAGVAPMILTPSEVSEAADVFPTKFLDIKRYHLVLAGEDPFAMLEVPHEHVRLRIEQELRNMLLRLRRLGLDAVTDARLRARGLTRIARPLAIQLSDLLRLAGKQVPAGDRTSAIFEAAAAVFDLNAIALASLAELRLNARPENVVGCLFGDVLNVVAQAVDVADRMKDPSQ